jgi:putative phosphoesterase
VTVVGLVSDTHLPRFGDALPAALVDGLRAAGATRILHCGDFTQPAAVPLFEALGPLDAVAGNNDAEELVRRFGDRRIVQVEDARIGLVHGHAGRRAAHENALAAFAGERVDAIFYGHSHRPRIERLPNGPLVVNPGSPTDKRTNPLYSFAVVRVDGAKVEAELVYYPKRVR